MTPTLEIKSGQGNYPVSFLGDWGQLNLEITALTNALIVIDARVSELHQTALAPALAKWPVLKISATEEEKTLAGVTRTLEWF